MTGLAEYIESQRAIIKREGFVLPKTSGSSMRPLIWGEDHCVVVGPLVGEPAVGDILMFRLALDGRNIVHRVVAVEGDAARSVYIARGDNCLGVERVTRDQIIGRVAEVHRLSGYRPWHAIPKKKFTVTDPAYRRYVHLWTLLWPLRRLWYHLRLRLPKL
ncbi:S26 family signal peptidase [bacterium]|nr:S26 family signal peptidase [bacterium]